LPVADLAEGYLGSRRPLYQIYAPLLIQEWSERYGHEAIQGILTEIGEGATWAGALEEVLGQSIEDIDKESRANIVARYEVLSESTQSEIDEARALLDAGKADDAAVALIGALERNPYDPSNERLIIDLLEALRVDRERSDSYFRLLDATMLARRSDADARFELAEWHFEHERYEDALNFCQSAAGIRPHWLAAHRLLSEIALKLDRNDLAYASLATLHEARPKHVQTLERLVVCARALDMTEESARWTRELEAVAPRSPVIAVSGGASD